MSKPEQKTTTATVSVPARPDHPGVWAAGRLWTSGQTEAELTDEQIHTIAARPGVMVHVNGQQVTADKPPASRLHHETLTVDEAAMLAEYRAKRTQDPSIAEKYGTSGAGTLKTGLSGDRPPQTVVPPKQPQGDADKRK